MATNTNEFEREIIFYGVVLNVQYYFEQGEDQTYDYPGSPDIAEIHKIAVGNDSQCIYELLPNHLVTQLENELINIHNDEY